MHSRALAPANVPAAHLTGALVVAGQELPAGQSEQLAAPPSAYVPSVHGDGVEEHPPAQDDPAGQEAQGSEESSPGKWKPAPQGDEGQKFDEAAEAGAPENRKAKNSSRDADSSNSTREEAPPTSANGRLRPLLLCRCDMAPFRRC